MVRLPTWAKSLLLLGVVLVAGASYAVATRQAADAIQVAGSASRLRIVMSESGLGSTGPATRGQLEGLIAQTYRLIGLLLDSEIGKSFPEVTGAEQRAWTALQLARDLAEEYDAGVAQPLVSQVARAAPAIAAYPEWSSIVVGDGTDARIDNAGGRAVAFLLNQMELAVQRGYDAAPGR